MKHMKVSCVKRPFPPVKCRLGCGEEFHGGLHRMLQVIPPLISSSRPMPLTHTLQTNMRNTPSK